MFAHHSPRKGPNSYVRSDLDPEHFSLAVFAVPGRGKDELTNQDRAKSWYNSPAALAAHAKGVIFAVADGMGGQGPKGAGRRASEIVMDTLGHFYRYAFSATMPAHEQLEAVIINAHYTIKREAELHPERYKTMGSTVAAALMKKKPDAEAYEGYVANVGDSRIYLVKDGKTIEQCSVDDVDKEENLLQYLGQDGYFQLHHRTMDLASGDYLILGTDGLTKILDEDALLRIVQKNVDAAMIGRRVREVHTQRGRPDDLGLVVVEVN